MVILLLLVTLFLSPAIAQERNAPARITGRVVAAETGVPLRGAMVQLAGGQSQTPPVSTDLNGRFELAERRIGRYALQVSKPGYAPTVFGRFADTVEYFEVLAGQRIDRGTIRLQVAAVISGRVQNESGEPLADVAVTAWRIEFPQPGIRMWRQLKDTSTNDLGEFRLHGLLPGRYHVFATRSPLPPESFVRTADSSVFVGSRLGWSGGLPLISEAIAVETMRGGEASGTTITLRQTREVRVSGSVIDSTGRPGTSSYVSIRPANSDGLPGNRVAQAMANGGRFTFNSLPAGAYRLTASAQPIRATPYRAVPQSESATLSISIQEDITGLVVQTQEETPVRVAATGRVFIDGAPAPTTRIQVMSWFRDENLIAPEAPDVFDLPASSVVTKADGQFIFVGSDGWFVLRPAGSTPFALKSVTVGGVDVTDGFDMKRATGPFEVHLTSQVSTVTGVVTDPDGGPAAICDVVLFSEDAATWKLPFSRRMVLLRANAEGKFVVTGLPPGQYLAIAPAVIDRALWADPDRLERWRVAATRLSIVDGEKTMIALKRN